MSRGLGRDVPSQSPIQAAAVVVAPVISFQNPLGVKGFCYRRVKNDVRDAGDLADLLRMGRLPEAGSPHRRPANCGSWCAGRLTCATPRPNVLGLRARLRAATIRWSCLPRTL